ncbi:MAG: hypothetical protein RLZZ367_1398 [Bacteroidota bacterium]|jgi:AraC-like DNA-binding protein
MAADAFYLPDYFTGGKTTDVYVQYYSTTKSSVKNRVVFSQNMLCLLLQGQKEVASAPVSHRITNHDILLLSAGSVLMSETVTPQHRFESILFFFSNSFLTEFCIKHRLDITGKRQSPAGMLVLKKDEYLQGFETTFALLRGANNLAMQQLKLEELLLYLLLKYPTEVKAYINHSLSASQATQQLKQVVSRYATQGLTIDELAFLCNMSTSTFKRRFTEVFAASPKEYFTTCRMKRAKQLLTMGKPVAEVCNELGYSTLSLFSTAYKKYYGHPPGQVRRIGPKPKLIELK